MYMYVYVQLYKQMYYVQVQREVNVHVQRHTHQQQEANKILSSPGLNKSYLDQTCDAKQKEDQIFKNNQKLFTSSNATIRDCAQQIHVQRTST